MDRSGLELTTDAGYIAGNEHEIGRIMLQQLRSWSGGTGGPKDKEVMDGNGGGCDGGGEERGPYTSFPPFISPANYFVPTSLVMFDEDCCLQCGKPMPVDNRIYCSDACQALDDSSPSLSTASSVWPSPSLHPISAGSVQELTSLALDMSLSTAKSVYTPAYPIWYDNDDDVEPLSVNPSDDALVRSHDALSYARRPSSTNTHSTIPLLHRHSSSSTTRSSTGHSANSTEEDSDISGPTCSSHHHRRRSYGTPLRPPAPLTSADVPEATITSRKRNRASLPSYFSLLTLVQMPWPEHRPAVIPSLPRTRKGIVVDGENPVLHRAHVLARARALVPTPAPVNGLVERRKYAVASVWKNLMAGQQTVNMGTAEGVVDYEIVPNACMCTMALVNDGVRSDSPSSPTVHSISTPRSRQQPKLASRTLAHSSQARTQRTHSCVGLSMYLFPWRYLSRTKKKKDLVEEDGWRITPERKQKGSQ
ncbi:hypothetical protein F5148DRAFT_1367088 [Russula earlei]|uniref:Uncharacterized protein n=1 Tax=Russula earlei TaxID=71964 RepID=A0ACC0UDA6_9AGAM|nr:hypothetical protein F5148DRAFT_1367088 [Russula earlei]